MANTAPSLAAALNLANQLNRGDGNIGARIPMMFYSDATVARGEPPIALKVNPHAVQFRQPKRITKKNTQAGTVYIHWSDAKGSNNDILDLAFKGRTGNISTKKDVPNQTSFVGDALQNLANFVSANSPGQGPTPNQGQAKLFTWARLYQLTSAPVLDFLPVGNSGNTRRSRVLSHILYRSPLFPRPIRFSGHFNQVLEFAEVAEQPWLVEWSFGFTVQKTSPNLTEITSYLTSILTGADASFANTVALANEQTQELENSDRRAQTSANFKSG